MCTVNGVGLFLAAINVWQYPRNYTGAFVLGNLVTAILMRNEVFGRVLYFVVNTCFAKVRQSTIPCDSDTHGGIQWPPLWFRLGCTSVLQHIGGIHSGCATSGFAWLLFRVTLIFINHKNNHDAVLIMGVITNLAVAISIASAFPWVRNTHHKWVSRVLTRFSGLTPASAFLSDTTDLLDGECIVSFLGKRRPG